MNWPETEDVINQRGAFADALVPDGTSPWHKAFARVPRHVFVARFEEQKPDGTWRPVQWGADGYLEWVYSDDALTTQLDEHGVPTSSSSQPSVMLAMLEALDVQDGHHVLELGTGTGYNLALLCDRLGDKNVTSIEPDAELVQAAVHRLEQTGQRPTVIAGDGRQGYARRAPYDRIIATVQLTYVPSALIEQSVEGAVIVAPLGYGLVRLVRNGPGFAAGRFLPTPAYFMGLRAPTAPPDFDAVYAAPAAPSAVHGDDVLDRLKFALSLILPGHTTCSWKDDEGLVAAVGIWTPDGSIAVAHGTEGVRQAGPRRLWDIVEQTVGLLPTGPLAREDFHVTVTPTEQTVYYRHTDGPRWHLPLPDEL